MTRIARAFGKALSIATLFAMLTACSGGSEGAATSGGGDSGGSSGGSGDSGGSGGGGDTTPAIEGVATPSSVSVVTATNAN